MKILIAYASVGYGHKKSAEVIYQHFKESDPSCQVELIDILDFTTESFRKFYISSYDFMVNHARWLWSLLFYTTTSKVTLSIIKVPRLFSNFVNTTRFRRKLLDAKPDIVISTHFLPSEVISFLKAKKLLDVKVVTVITDFGVHPFWVTRGTDLFAVASDYTKYQLIDFGIAQEKIAVTGIPIDKSFAKAYDKAKLRGRLGLHDRFTVMVMTGSFGIGPIEEIVDLLQGKVQLVVVCARNQRLYDTLSAKDYKAVKIYGFVDNLAELMAVSELIISKPGGLSVSELLSMELVPIFTSEIPGQETGNIEALAEYCIGSRFDEVEDIEDIVLYYRDNPEDLSEVKKKMRLLKKPFSTVEFYDAVRKSSLWSGD